MSSRLQNGDPHGETVIVRTMDEYLARKHGSSHDSPALAALYRDRYGDSCSALTCDRSADVVLFVLNAPTLSIVLCENHAVQLRDENSDLVDHLPTLTPETEALLPRNDQAGSPSAHLTLRSDESELRDDDAPEGSPRSSDER